MFAVSSTVLKTQHCAEIAATPFFSSPHGLFYYDSRTRTSHLLIRTISLWARHCSVNCNKKVNHEMPAERFSSSLAPRYCAHFISAANWTRARVKKWAQNGDRSTPPREQKQARYQYLISWLG
jgi:hypothetical protein